ncbi:voltage-dependent calcium channel beta subunit-associated regulatory protein isoform X2 [Oryzias melastigma]|uniref:CACN subunit beta associated regulatory protein b n=1 Tax=Oryzias melastigma TaxID=30732 RepID=A0A3B3DAQ2_ORYME|nr:voltage-dependent calcium channel beta subunit-associated regulatory protein isoform X2 [Oryzias melastigma]
MSNDSTVWNVVPENSTDIPFQAEEHRDGYLLLLVILSVFLVGTLVIVSFLVLACRHRSHGGCSRSSDDPEKTAAYTESQPTHEITIQVDESDCLSMVSSHDQETERFLSTGPTGRRVSFNEAALFDHGKKAQEKGRRYTLTEGDFHHLKNARLTNLHIPPPALKIVTIHECDSAENTITMTTRPAAKSALSIFQGEVMAAGGRGGGAGAGTVVGNGASPAASGGADSPRPVLQLLSKLRRHASLEGASPYFKIKKWKLDSSQRASSLDTRGSPKRRHFQRQRAASESMDHDDHEAHRIDLIQYIAHTKEASFLPRQPSPRLLPPPSTPPPSLGRVEVEAEPGCSHSGPGEVGLSLDPHDMPSVVRRGRASSPNGPPTQDPQSLYRDIWTLRASLEQYAASDQSSNNDRSSVCSDADSVCSRERLLSVSSQDLGDEAEMEDDGVTSVKDKSEAQKSTRSKQGGVESERGGGEAESGTRKLLQMDSGYASIEAPPRGPDDLRLFGSSSVTGSPKDRTAHEKRHHFTNAGRTGTIGESFELHLFEEEPEDDLLLGAANRDADSLSWLTYGQMITPRDAAEPPAQTLTLHQRDYSIDEKTDALFHEFLRHDPQFDQQESPRKYRSRIHLRKQWQRHKQWSDPGVRHFQSSFERHRTPLRRGESVNYPLESSYHSTLPRIVSAPDEEAGDGAGCSPEAPKGKTQNPITRSEVHTPSSPLTHPPISEKGPQGDSQEDGKRSGQLPETPEECSPQLPDAVGFGPQTVTAELTDKLTANLSETLFRSPHRTKDATAAAECVTLKAAHASPDHSPV